MSWRLAPVSDDGERGCLARRSAGGAWRRVCRGRWGCARSLAPRQRPFFAERRLDHAPVGGLPRPVQPDRSSYSRSSSAQARCERAGLDPLLKRSWTVDLGPNSRGSAAHWLPVRASQISPSKMARSSRRGRPGFLRGLSMRQQRRQPRPQRVVDPPDRRVVLLGRCRVCGRLRGIHARSLPRTRHFPDSV